MCGAFSIRINPYEAREIHNATIQPWKPIYNARPGEWLPIVTEAKPKNITSAFWGYIPRWMDPKKGRAVINARGETIAKKPYFRSAVAGQRCIIPADGFYEWQKGGPGKIPFYFHRRDDKPFSFAGVYDVLPGQQQKLGFAIITTMPNELVGRIHDRMPAMLMDDQVEMWLNPDTAADQAVQLIQPYPDSLMASYEVSKAVNFARNKGPEVVQPVMKTGM